MFDGIGGFNGWRVFGTSEDWQDLSKPAGYTAQVVGVKATVTSILNMAFFFYSPNLSWFLASVLYYSALPYKISGPTFCSSLTRLGANAGLLFAYYFFFYWALYLRSWSKRKFTPGSFPLAVNMRHNLWYWSLGVIQWTAYEIAMEKAWASGIVVPATFENLVASPQKLLLNAAILLAVPIWRDVHFYSTHRFTHIRAVYRLVHSLHHRNTDPEPFSGLTMHPIEHLYYFSNALVPCIYIGGLTPLVFHWIGFHLTFAPAAGHSGFEDHFGSDQYHHIHHTTFESNYGSPNSAFIDQYFGTFRAMLGKSKEYKGEWKEDKKKSASKVWSSQGRLGLWATKRQGVYDISMLALAAFTFKAMFEGGATESEGQLIGLLAAAGPTVYAFVINKLSGDRMNSFWPFHKEKFGLFYTVLTGFLFSILPLYHFVKWVSMACRREGGHLVVAWFSKRNDCLLFEWAIRGRREREGNNLYLSYERKRRAL
ncbi:hypothetical protein TrRE_jg5937 [Triparma retinervis]|uniref:Fatty acid hydroxylase domain-containing protein n=1 Tax=Triparma retinervis TaxID=2557542 RepID=A0A9W7AK16_9STRA|nr:hypothetical protein TrRE_jg5937 [Triparma retinervis]